MKKKIIAIATTFAFIASLSVVLLNTTTVVAEEDQEITLYAGQDIRVGYVDVTQDSGTLYIKYVIDEEGWCMTETHLHVATDVDGIPQNRTGNPIPGQFEKSQEHNCVTEYTYEIPLEEIADEEIAVGDDLAIAAHAEVVRPIKGCYETVWQIGDIEEDQMSNPVDELNWPGQFGVFPSFPDPFVIGVNDDSEFPWNSNSGAGYATDFDVEFEYDGIPIDARLTVSWSPGGSGAEQKEVFLDETKIGTTPERSGTPVSGWWEQMARYQDEFDLSLTPGTHTLNFQHLKGDGTLWDWVRLERLCIQEETAWAEGTRFVEKGNWATYFTYTVERELVDTVTVDPSDPTGADSVALEDGVDYDFVVSGTWTNKTETDDEFPVDAQYVSYDGWTTDEDGPSWDVRNLDLQINETFVNWGSYSSSHTYTYKWIGDGSTVNFRVFDGDPSTNTINPSWYGDNDGELVVEIYRTSW